MAQPDYKFTTSMIMEALKENRANMSAAADYLTEKWGEALGSCSRSYVNNACKDRPELVEFLHDLRQGFIDRAEQNIFEAVMTNDLRVSLTVAQTLGKDRGWTQKQEVEVVDPEQSIARIQEARARAKELRKMRDEAADPAVAGGSDPAENCTIAEHPLGEQPVNTEKQSGEAR